MPAATQAPATAAVRPGQMVSIEIVAPPTNEAARKTLVRLCRKDPRVVRHDRMQHDKRPSLQWWRRGGRLWEHRMRSKPAVALAPGQSYTVRATLDVLRDLESVRRFVKVAPAK